MLLIGRRCRIPEIVFGFLLATALFATGTAIVSSHVSQQNQHISATDQTADSKNEKNEITERNGRYVCGSVDREKLAEQTEEHEKRSGQRNDAPRDAGPCHQQADYPCGILISSGAPNYGF